MESTIQLVPFMLLVVALFALMVRPSTSSQIPRSKSQAPNPGFRTAITNKGLSYGEFGFIIYDNTVFVDTDLHVYRSLFLAHAELAI